MKKQFATTDAVRLLQEGGQNEPSHERIEITRWLMDTCSENGWDFTRWSEPLYPALDSFGDVELLLAAEEAFGVTIDDADIRAAPMETFGDLVCYLEPHIAPCLTRAINAQARIAGASCATQAAFYALRRMLCEVGMMPHQVHGLRPCFRLLDLPPQQAELLANQLSKNHKMEMPLRRVLWGRIETEALILGFLLLSALICLLAALDLPGHFTSATALWVLINTVFIHSVLRFSRCQWPKAVTTLGDVARKIAANTPVVETTS